MATAATYRVNLHCPDCAQKIKRPLLRMQGVHSVDVNFDKNEVKVIGAVDAKKIHERISKLSKRNVDVLKVETNFKETVVVEKIVKETKEPTIHTTVVKVHLHCDQCETDLRKKLLKHKGIYNVKSDIKAQSLTIEGTIEAEKVASYIREKAHKHVEIVKNKQIKKEDIKKEVKEEKKEKEKVDENPKVKVIDVQEVKEIEDKLKESKTPYIIHYVYAPQWFSDEDPNACTIV